MQILISGATGLIGTALAQALKGDGHTIVRLTRAKAQQGDIYWNPLAGKLDPTDLDNASIDAVVHLAGESIAGRWTVDKKKAILESRKFGTETLSHALANMQQKPKVFVSASAIGFYGLRGAELLTEASAPGTGFLADVCKLWEESTAQARSAGIRTVNIRLGVVLSPKGGALSQMLFPFKMCAGGIFGSGQQFMSCIALDDVVTGIQFVLKHETISGPVNLCGPNAVTNAEFTKTLGKVLGRPTVFPLPAFAAKLVFGEMADDLLLGSTRVKPERLIQAGYSFKYPDLEAMLRGVLK